MDYAEHKHAISKKLSANDVGINGSHQAGICIPRNPDILSFFPTLGTNEKNPRVKLRFSDDGNFEWTFVFIYYNNRLFGGTRNEYRLTCMTSYIRQNDLIPGDEIILSMDISGDRQIRYKRANRGYMIKEGVIRLSNEWKIVKLKEG